MSNELIKLDELQPLVSIYAKHNEILTKAKAASELSMTAINAISLKDRAISPAFIDKLFEAPINIRRLATERKKQAEDERKPITQKMNAIASLFTGIENGFTAIIDEISQKQNEWEREKSLINKEAEQKRETELRASQLKIQRIGNIKSAILYSFGDALAKKFVLMNTAYNSKSASELPSYAATLKAWTPILKNEEWTAIITDIKSEENADIFKEASDSVWPELSDKWKASLTAEVNRLFDYTLVRVKELQTPTQAKLPIVDVTAKVVQEVMDMAKFQEAVTDIAIMSETVVIPESLPLLQAKGSVKKLKYVAQSHKAIAAIIQAYVSGTLSKLTIDEANKKFSFCFTDANMKLNDKKNPVTIVMDGLSVIEDFQTKVSK